MSNRIIKDTIAITVITLVAGLALGVVQDITADPIAKQEAQAAAKASGGGMAAIREAVEKAETETRAKYENGAQSDLSGILYKAKLARTVHRMP